MEPQPGRLDWAIAAPNKANDAKQTNPDFCKAEYVMKVIASLSWGRMSIRMDMREEEHQIHHCGGFDPIALASGGDDVFIGGSNENSVGIVRFGSPVSNDRV